MATCKYCGEKMDWGQDAEGKWVKLVPIEVHGDLDRTHQDENGVLRAQHKCTGWTPAVKVARLAKTIPATDVLPGPAPWSEPDADGEVRRLHPGV